MQFIKIIVEGTNLIVLDMPGSIGSVSKHKVLCHLHDVTRIGAFEGNHDFIGLCILEGDSDKACESTGDAGRVDGELCPALDLWPSNIV